MINFLKRAVLFALLSGVFLIVGIIPLKTVSASVIISQTIVGGALEFGRSGTSANCVGQSIVAPQAFNLNQIEIDLFKSNDIDTNQLISIRLLNDFNGSVIATSTNSISQNDIFAGDFPATGSPSSSFLFDNIPISNNQYFIIEANTDFRVSGGNFLLWKTTNTIDPDEYIFGHVETSNNDLCTNYANLDETPVTAPQRRDATFKIHAAPADSIEITFPADTSTPPYDFSNWIIEFSTATSTTATSTDFYLKRIFTVLSTSTIIEVAGGSIELESPLNINNIFAFDPNTTYFSFAQLRYFADFQAVGEIVATSDIISFTTSNLSENDLSFFDLPTSTSTEFAVTCDPESGFFVNSFCNLARFLFVPTTQSIQNFSNLKEQITTKPPIGYFTLIKNEFTNLTATGTPIFVLEGLEGLETGFLDQVRDVLKILFFLIFGFWLLRRVINFDFHL